MTFDKVVLFVKPHSIFLLCLPFSAREYTDQIGKLSLTRSLPCAIASVDLARLLCSPRNPPNVPHFQDTITLDKVVSTFKQEMRNTLCSETSKDSPNRA